jgi:hypothetical protein
MMRLASTAIASAAWSMAGVAAALLLVQLLAPLGVTALFLALSAAAAYAGLTEIGARRGRDPVLGSLAEAAGTGLVQFLGVLALLVLAGPWAGHARTFLTATHFRSYAAVALGGAFAVSLLLRLVVRRRPDLPGRLLVQGMTFWVSPFFGFFSPAVFAAMAVTGFGGAPTGWAGLGVAAGVMVANLTGRLLADWLTDARR